MLPSRLQRCGSGDQRHVLDRTRERTDDVERVRQLLGTGSRHRAAGRHETDHAAEGCRADHRPGGLRTERERRHVRGDGGGRAARRSSGRVFERVRVARRSRREVRQFGSHRLAEHEAPGCAHCRDARGVRARHVSEIDRRTVFGRDVCRIDGILHRDGQPVQRPAPVDAIELACGRERARRVEPGKCAHVLLAILDRIEERMRHRFAADFMSRNHAGESLGGQAIQRSSHFFFPSEGRRPDPPGI